MIYYFTDGSCRSNGNPNSEGGFGIVKVDEYNNILWEYSKRKSPTTNNEMELMAILTALKYIKKKEETDCIIYSDSAYCVNLINNWMYNWKDNGWKRPKNQEIKNLDIIKQIYDLAYLAKIEKVAGHSGILGNEIADKLATGERKSGFGDLIDDD